MAFKDLDEITFYDLAIRKIDDIRTLDAIEKYSKRRRLELQVTEKTKWISNVKSLIMKVTYEPDLLKRLNLSDYLARETGSSYGYLSNRFSAEAKISIEQYRVQMRIERVCDELINYPEDTVTEVALRLKYSSVAHLSNQFKEVTGKTPSKWREKQLKKAA